MNIVGDLLRKVGVSVFISYVIIYVSLIHALSVILFLFFYVAFCTMLWVRYKVGFRIPKPDKDLGDNNFFPAEKAKNAFSLTNILVRNELSAALLIAVLQSCTCLSQFRILIPLDSDWGS